MKIAFGSLTATENHEFGVTLYLVIFVYADI